MVSTYIKIQPWRKGNAKFSLHGHVHRSIIIAISAGHQSACLKPLPLNYTAGERCAMIDANKLMSMVDSLPVDIKTQLIERLIHSLNPSQKEIDTLWAAEAEQRVEELKSGKVKAIPGDVVFKEKIESFSK
jgi:putative addiction module component (TIGR02574 family)